MEFDPQFFLLLVSNGVLVGLMYSLIALGFVLVYKATDAINFAQGEFVMMAGYLAALGTFQISFWLGLAVSIAGMVAFGFLLERGMLRPLIGRPVVAVIMATIGLAAALRGIWQMVAGVDTFAVTLPVNEDLIKIWEIAPDEYLLQLQPVQLVGAGVALAFLAGFTWFFMKSRMGVAMRAVADNQQVAMAMGINVERYFALAWAMAGLVAALGGVVWSSMLGVDTHLAVIGLKVFPVVILGGLDSIAGAIIGGLIIGIVESVVAGYLDPYVGGGMKDFAPYVLMILVLMFKPYGIFGKRKIERV